MFDYSVCDLCPYALDSGTACENCQAIKAERALLSRMAELDEEDFYG